MLTPDFLADKISIHALRVEGDSFWNAISTALSISIHALRVEGDAPGCCLWRSMQNFYPRPPGGGRPEKPFAASGPLRISIHALRVEGDCFRPLSDFDEQISIHALRVEGDLFAGDRFVHDRHFYPRPPGGGRPV